MTPTDFDQRPKFHNDPQNSTLQFKNPNKSRTRGGLSRNKDA